MKYCCPLICKIRSPSKARLSSPRKRSASGSPLKSPSGRPPKKTSASSKGGENGVEPNQYPSRPPVVLVFQDLESFPAHVLQDFVTICR